MPLSLGPARGAGPRDAWDAVLLAIVVATLLLGGWWFFFAGEQQRGDDDREQHGIPGVARPGAAGWAETEWHGPSLRGGSRPLANRAG